MVCSVSYKKLAINWEAKSKIFCLFFFKEGECTGTKAIPEETFWVAYWRRRSVKVCAIKKKKKDNFLPDSLKFRHF